MRELRDPAWINFKAALFLCTGLLASALLVLDRPTLKAVFLLQVAIWAFCRAYYFAFHVLEHYVDPGYRFSGLLSLVRYLLLVGSRRPPSV